MERRYTETHEWVEIDGGTARVGISDFAQAQLGDVVFLELPAVGSSLKPGDAFGVIESVKAASDLYAPIGGTVLEVNAPLSDSPETVNRDPYGDGWLMKLEIEGPAPANLMDEAAYRSFTEGAGH